MKTVTCSLALACCLCGGSMMAQMLTERSRVNPIGEAQVRSIASRLIIGMPEVDALRLLSTSGVNVNATIHYTNHWLRVFSYTNETPGHSSFWLKLRQKPTEHGLLMAHGLVVITNGILEGAFLRDVQLARTNAP
jgi:hypothetical protein